MDWGTFWLPLVAIIGFFVLACGVPVAVAWFYHPRDTDSFLQNYRGGYERRVIFTMLLAVGVGLWAWIRPPTLVGATVLIAIWTPIWTLAIFSFVKKWWARHGTLLFCVGCITANIAMPESAFLMDILQIMWFATMLVTVALLLVWKCRYPVRPPSLWPAFLMAVGVSVLNVLTTDLSSDSQSILGSPTLHLAANDTGLATPFILGGRPAWIPYFDAGNLWWPGLLLVAVARVASQYRKPQLLVGAGGGYVAGLFVLRWWPFNAALPLLFGCTLLGLFFAARREGMTRKLVYLRWRLDPSIAMHFEE